MRFLILLSALCLLALVSATPIDPRRWLINRPSQDITTRSRRQTPGVKASVRVVRVKGYSPRATPPPNALRKGEYVCGNKVCKLMPGEIPKGCNGICQYPV